MLEANSHNQLKALLRSDLHVWPHNLTLSRLVSRSLRRRDKSLFSLPLGCKNLWWPGLLIPLSLDSSNSVLVLSDKQRLRLLKHELPKLKRIGFNLPIWEGREPPPSNKVWVISYKELIHAYKNGFLKSKQLIFPDSEKISDYLRDAYLIKISKDEWEKIIRVYPSFEKSILDFYQNLTKRLFVNSISENSISTIDKSSIIVLKDLLGLLNDLPYPWKEVINSINDNWVSWAKLNHKVLDWIWYMEPLEPIENIKEIFEECPFIMLSRSWENKILDKSLNSINCPLNVCIKVGNLIPQDPIQLFVPLRQPLPNTEFFSHYILDQTRRLILGLNGITIVIIDDYELMAKLSSQIAADFGKRVIVESTTPDTNGVIFSSSNWWLENQDYLPNPKQLIFAVLPFPSLKSPLLNARLEKLKLQGRDWFRELLLPEILNVIPFAILPLRACNGRVAILDGRLRSRNWGNQVFKSLEPWHPLDHLTPY